MVIGKSCLFYQDARCLVKGRFCDLFCDAMKFYDMDEGEAFHEEEEAWSRKKDLVWFERLGSISEEASHDK